VQQLVICGTKVQLHKRRLVQAAQGTQRWVPWSERLHASDAIAELKARGTWIVVAEQTTGSVRPDELAPIFPVTMVLGGERSGIAIGRRRCRDPNARNGELAQRRDRCCHPPLLAHRAFEANADP
jgi:tRNA G18 (ribose-2'-O)-methylase SpoU